MAIVPFPARTVHSITLSGKMFRAAFARRDDSRRDNVAVHRRFRDGSLDPIRQDIKGYVPAISSAVNCLNRWLFIRQIVRRLG